MANCVKVPEWLVNVGRGLLMGGADIIPGVSGGTVALILGIYKRLITALSSFDVQFLTHLRNKKIRAAAEHTDLDFLGTLLGGIGLGIIGLASLMHYLLEHQTQHTFGAFFGLILASSWHVARIVDRWSARSVLMFFLGAVAAYSLVALPLLKSPPETAWYIFACGSISICAMILPGISGAFLLLILGAYYELTRSLEQIKDFEITAEPLLTIGAFLTGAVIGLLSFSKFLHWLLAHYQTATIAVLCGFMIGSLRKIWPFKIETPPTQSDFKLKQFMNEWPDFTDGSVWLTILIATAAFVFVLLLEWWTGRRLKVEG